MQVMVTFRDMMTYGHESECMPVVHKIKKVG